MATFLRGRRLKQREGIIGISQKGKNLQEETTLKEGTADLDILMSKVEQATKHFEVFFLIKRLKMANHQELILTYSSFTQAELLKESGVEGVIYRGHDKIWRRKK